MDFEKILLFILLGVYLLSLLGKKKPSSEETTTQDKSGLKTVFQIIAKQIKEHTEASKKNAERKHRQQIDTVKRDIPQEKTSLESWGEVEDLDIDFPVEDALIGEDKEVVEEVLLDIPDKAIASDSILIKNESSHKPVLKKNLQQAVVWSEILAPPVALREDCKSLYRWSL